MAKEVTVYTMNRCPFCLQLKLFLKRQGVEFTEINTSENPASEWQIQTYFWFRRLNHYTIIKQREPCSYARLFSYAYHYRYAYSTVTLFARFLGWSISQPLTFAV